MIAKPEFEGIVIDVKKSVTDAFEFLKNKIPEDRYILFLAEGDYSESLKNSVQRFNPFVINSLEDQLKDESRQEFFIQYMRQFYAFPSTNPKTDDNTFRLTMELMVYTHIWESKPFLKQLHRFAILINNKSYPWRIQIPDFGKHDFIRNEIRDLFKINAHELSEVITKGYHSSLRNAFAHSEYSFSEPSKFIHLHNFKENKWEIKSISFDNWSIRFAYSALLVYYFYEIKHIYRTSCIADLGKKEFEILAPINFKSSKLKNISYDESRNRFEWVR